MGRGEKIDDNDSDDVVEKDEINFHGLKGEYPKWSYICIIYIFFLERNDLSIVVTVREREIKRRETMKCEEINDNQN